MNLDSLYFKNRNLLLVFFLLALASPFIGGYTTLNANVFDSNDPDDETCEAVNCEAGFFQTIDNDGKLVRYEYDGVELGFRQISVFGFTVNATAYNIEDDYLYTIARNSRRIIRFDSDCNRVSLGVLALPQRVQVGSSDNEGNYYVYNIDSDEVYRIDVDAPTLQVEIFDLPLTSPTLDIADWVYLTCENKFYGVGRNNLLYSYDPATNTSSNIILSGLAGQTGHYGAAFTDISGALYVSNNNSGNIYSIDINAGVATLILNGPTSGTNDGTSCPCGVPPFPTLNPQDDEICISNDEATQIFINDFHSFADLDHSSFEIIEEPTNGQVFYTEFSGSVFYLSNDSTQPDSFVYRICLDIPEIFCEEATVRYLPSYNETIEETICQGEEIVIDGFPFSEAGSYDLTYVAENGCDSIITLVLDVVGDSDQIFNEEICAGESFTFNDEEYTETGTFEFTFTSQENCDSTVVLDLTVLPSFEDTIAQSICEGVEFMFDDQVYDSTGTYVVSYLSLIHI